MDSSLAISIITNGSEWQYAIRWKSGICGDIQTKTITLLSNISAEFYIQYLPLDARCIRYRCKNIISQFYSKIFSAFNFYAFITRISHNSIAKRGLRSTTFANISFYAH